MLRSRWTDSLYFEYAHLPTTCRVIGLHVACVRWLVEEKEADKIPGKQAGTHDRLFYVWNILEEQ